tara:strand:+ start:73252 stop:73842 length:591 start_codon:yes stop_codon:yes gene_type:complete
MTATPDDILQYWFGDLDAQGMSAEHYHKLWFASTAEQDAYCAQHFGGRVEQALAGELDDWSSNDATLIALILLLDQFTRTIYRGTPAAFAGDERARTLAGQAISSGRHQQLPPIHRVFLYLPLEHSEQLADQQQCVALFTALGQETDLAQIQGFTRFAVAHHDVIEKFGRFPHRNSILGRSSTPAELAHLEQHGGF